MLRMYSIKEYSLGGYLLGMTLISKNDDGKQFNAPFKEEENTKLMKVAKDFNIGMVYCKGYATLMAQDGIPLPLDPFEPSNEHLLCIG